MSAQPPLWDDESEPPGLDEPTSHNQRWWQAETTLTDPLPSFAGLWSALQDPTLSPSLRTAVDRCVQGSATLRAALLQSLEEQGAPRASLAEAYQARVGRRIRPATIETLMNARVHRAQWKIRFTNLVSGRFTELMFFAAYDDQARRVGLRLVEDTAARNFLDYRLVPLNENEPFELSINVKNAGVQMASAAAFFGLEPEETIPMATYKMFGAAGADIPPLVYVYLVDWPLLERLRRAYWQDVLSEHERYTFRLLTNVAGIPRNVEDAFITATVDERLDRLAAAVGYDTVGRLPFRAVSAARCQQIFYENHRRSPYVFIKKMNTDPNVHINVPTETIAFDDLLATALSTPRRRAELLDGLARTKNLRIPDPPL